MRRRDLLRGVGAAAAATALAGRSRTADAEPPPETTKIRVHHSLSLCQAPQKGQFRTGDGRYCYR